MHFTVPNRCFVQKNTHEHIQGKIDMRTIYYP